MRLISLSLVVAFVTLAANGHALAPGDRARGFRDGANHHLGDDGLVRALGRAPDERDGEAARMRAHLVHVRQWLGSRPATQPSLQGRRNELLGALDAYTERGVTPQNTHLPWRSPVFIDDDGRICAVGYLMEVTAGRPTAERVARGHRYELLEDIAGKVPEVQGWVEGSGFSLEELASIQPGYSAPTVEQYQIWKIGIPANGPFARVDDYEGKTSGSIAGGHMEGPWERRNSEGAVIGKATLQKGAGTWTSFAADGTKLAEGPYAGDRPHGSWRFYHPSGELAGEGRFERGKRHGAWRFFHDDKARVPVAEGQFDDGMLVGNWRHFDASGKLLALFSTATPAGWEHFYSRGGYLLDVVPGSDGIHHWVHQGNAGADGRQLDLFYDGKRPIFRTDDGQLHDADGNALVRHDDHWESHDCRWSRAEKRSARAGDVVTLHGLITRDRKDNADRSCAEEGTPVTARRAKALDAVAASTQSIRSATPEFLKKVLAADDANDDRSDADAQIIAQMKLSREDMSRVLVSSMAWYVEYPHVDGRFIALFKTLPGYAPKY